MNRRRVLIETSWNVKTAVPTEEQTRMSINRNIVECKVCQSIRQRWWLLRINRNIVECKGKYNPDCKYAENWY